MLHEDIESTNISDQDHDAAEEKPYGKFQFGNGILSNDRTV